MRHVAAALLRQLKFPGKDVAAVLGLSAAYVATLHQRALREGTAALVARRDDPARPVRRLGPGGGGGPPGCGTRRSRGGSG